MSTMKDVSNLIVHVSRKPQYKDVYGRTIEIPQRTRILKSSHWLKIHNASSKLALSILG